MCRPDPVKSDEKEAKPRRPFPARLLLSLDSYSAKHHGGVPPPPSSCLLTTFFLLAVLSSIEYLLCLCLTWLSGDTAVLHPLLSESLRHRQIVARHVGVDALSCLTCAVLGWKSRHVIFGGSQYDKKMNDAAGVLARGAYEQRLFAYHPAAFRIALLFFVYQIKNLYDSIVWNDGPEYIFHHVFSMITAWGAMFPGCGLFYVIFFFGLSEISTAVLCLLANLDSKAGVPGLGDAFPTAKLVLGLAFVILFITCRCILWPMFGWHFCRDLHFAMKHLPRDDVRMKPRWMRFFFVSLAGISILQVAWLGQIVVVAKQELTQAGFL